MIMIVVVVVTIVVMKMNYRVFVLYFNTKLHNNVFSIQNLVSFQLSDRIPDSARAGTFFLPQPAAAAVASQPASKERQAANGGRSHRRRQSAIGNRQSAAHSTQQQGGEEGVSWVWHKQRSSLPGARPGGGLAVSLIFDF